MNRAVDNLLSGWKEKVDRNETLYQTQLDANRKKSKDLHSANKDAYDWLDLKNKYILNLKLKFFSKRKSN